MEENATNQRAVLVCQLRTVTLGLSYHLLPSSDGGWDFDRTLLFKKTGYMRCWLWIGRTEQGLS